MRSGPCSAKARGRRATLRSKGLGDDKVTEIKYGDLAKKALKEVEGLEEPFRAVAYKTILDELIKDAKSAGRESKPHPALGQTELSSKRDPVEAFMGRAVDASTVGGLFPQKGFLVEKSLAVLKLARDEFGIEGLTATQIGEILTRKFRVGSVHARNISRDLGGSTQYVSRVTDDQGRTTYLLMVQGEQHLGELLTRLQGTT